MKIRKIKVELLFIAMLLLAIVSCKEKVKIEEPTQQGLVSFYNFQGNALDMHGTNNGFENNVMYISDSTQPTNQILNLNGINSFIKLSNPFDFESKTINVWLNASDRYSGLEIIYSSDSPSLNYGLTILSTKKIDKIFELYFNVSNNIDTVVIEPNRWYNATIAIEDKKYSYYLNGNQIKSGVIEDYICSNTGDTIVTVGCDRTMQQRFFYGKIDNLRVYNGKLFDDEIKTIYRYKLKY